MCDLLWSDPEQGIHGWAENTRGISYTFGEDVVRKFCKQLKIEMIVRGHQVRDLKTQLTAKITMMNRVLDGGS